MSSSKWRPFCSGGDGLTYVYANIHLDILVTAPWFIWPKVASAISQKCEIFTLGSYYYMKEAAD